MAMLLFIQDVIDFLFGAVSIDIFFWYYTMFQRCATVDISNQFLASY